MAASVSAAPWRVNGNRSGGLTNSADGDIVLPRRRTRRQGRTNESAGHAGAWRIVTGGAAGIGFAIAQRLRPRARASACGTAMRGRSEAAARELGAHATASTSRTRTLWLPRFARPSARSGSVERSSAAPASPARTRPSRSTRSRTGSRSRHQPHRRLPLQRAVVAAHGRRTIRAHRQHRVDRRQGRQPERLGLQRLEGGRDRAHQVARQGTCEDRRPRQLRDAGGGEDRHVRRR